MIAEAIKIAIEFKNPLEIPISISSVSLICELSATSDETNSGELQAVISKFSFLLFLLLSIWRRGKFIGKRKQVITILMLTQMQVAQLLESGIMKNMKT